MKKCTCCGRICEDEEVVRNELYVGRLCEECAVGYLRDEECVAVKKPYVQCVSPTRWDFEDYARRCNLLNVIELAINDLEKDTKLRYWYDVYRCSGKCGLYLKFSCIDNDNVFFVCHISILDNQKGQFLKVEYRYWNRKITILYDRSGNRKINLGKDYGYSNNRLNTYLNEKEQAFYVKHHPFYYVKNVQYRAAFDKARWDM